MSIGLNADYQSPGDFTFTLNSPNSFIVTNAGFDIVEADQFAYIEIYNSAGIVIRDYIDENKVRLIETDNGYLFVIYDAEFNIEGAHHYVVGIDEYVYDDIPILNPRPIDGDYELILADAQRQILVNNTDPTVITVPADADVDFTNGTSIQFIQQGIGAITWLPDSGVTVNNKDDQDMSNEQWSVVWLYKIATNNWVITGDLDEFLSSQVDYLVDENGNFIVDENGNNIITITV